MLAYRTCFESPATPGENASNDPSEAPTSRRENMNENGTAVVGLSRMVRLGQILSERRNLWDPTPEAAGPRIISGFRFTIHGTKRAEICGIRA